MNYGDIISDIQKLVGRQLESIRPGAGIVLLGIDLSTDRIELKTSKGQIKHRPLSEIRTLWEALCKQPAIHVEQVLRGSGSSRNQPETILANLPYIEWLRIDRKKHIAYVSKATHEIGTLKQMDPIQAHSLVRKSKSKLSNVEDIKAIIVTSDIAPAAQSLEHMIGLSVKALQPGVYISGHQKEHIILVAKDTLPKNIEPGTYVMVPSHSIATEGTTVILADSQFTLVRLDGVGFAIRTRKQLW